MMQITVKKCTWKVLRLLGARPQTSNEKPEIPSDFEE